MLRYYKTTISYIYIIVKTIEKNKLNWKKLKKNSMNFLNVSVLGADLTSNGNEFHLVAPLKRMNFHGQNTEFCQN
jgi:hypothetical protein